MIGILQICIVVVSQNKDTDNDKSTGSDNKSKSYTPQISQSLRNLNTKLLIRRGNRRIDFSFAIQLSQTEPSRASSPQDGRQGYCNSNPPVGR